MKTYIAVASEPIKPISPGEFKDSDWGQVVFFTVVGPIVLLCANEIWGVIKSRVTRTDKKHEAELKQEALAKEAEIKNKDALLNEVVTQYRALMSDLMSRNEEDIKSLQATQTTTVQVLATVAENLKHYAEIASKRSDETRLILDEIRRASSHTVLESMNSHVKITRISLDNQKQIIAMLQDSIALNRKIHERLDGLIGDSRNES